MMSSKKQIGNRSASFLSLAQAVDLALKTTQHSFS